MKLLLLAGSSKEARYYASTSSGVDRLTKEVGLSMTLDAKNGKLESDCQVEMCCVVCDCTFE